MSVNGVSDSEGHYRYIIKEAYFGFMATPGKIMCLTKDRKEIAINRSVFLLLSPLLRSIIGDIPSSILPTLFLPEISASSLMKLTDFLQNETADSYLSLTECKTVLEAATMLNIPMQGLCFGGDTSEGTMELNIATIMEDSSIKNMFDIERRKGKKIQLVCEKIKQEPTYSIPDPVNSRTLAPNENSGLSFISSSTRSSTISTSRPAMNAPSNISAPPGLSAGSLPNVRVFSPVSLPDTVTLPFPSTAAAASPHSKITGLTSTSAPRPISSPCNYSLECEVCGQKLISIRMLEQHCSRHFIGELEDQYSNIIYEDGFMFKCTICNTVFKQKHRLLLHIGCKHGKVSDILKQKGYAALPCPVLLKSNSAMQKQLIQIMKEEMSTD